MQNTNVKVVYSLRIHIGLQKLGFKPVMEMKNPKCEGLNCWVYEDTKNFREAFNRLIG